MKFCDNLCWEISGEYFWYIVMYVWVLVEYVYVDIDVVCVLKMLLIYDFVEIDVGDVLIYGNYDIVEIEVKEVVVVDCIFGFLFDV